MNDDPELLRRYAEEKSEPAFAELVRRHVNFVYGVALRRLGGDAHAAEDATQQVFTALAQKARALVSHPVLSAWLYTTTRNVAAQMVRTARRQQLRAQEAQNMKPESSPPDWEKLRPVLDDVLDELRDDDRQAVLLRFFEGRSFADVGARLRLTDNAARMRVERALEKMHAALRRRGVTSTTAALGVALAGQAAVMAPTGLAPVVTGAALAGAGAGAATVTAWATFMSMTKLQVGVAGVLTMAGLTGYTLEARKNSDLRTEIVGLRKENAAMVSLRDDNLRLSRNMADLADLRNDDSEFARLNNEAATLRTRLQEVARAEMARAQAARAADIYDVTKLDQIPQANTRTPPLYPAELRTAGIEGEVLVDFVVDINGEVKNAYAAKSTHRGFEAPAIQAVSQWKFRPGRLQGREVNAHMQVPIVFRVGKDAPKK